MLVLGGKVNERFFVGDNIVVTVVRVGKGYVRLGFEAPREIPIVRERVAMKRQDSDDTAKAR